MFIYRGDDGDGRGGRGDDCWSLVSRESGYRFRMADCDDQDCIDADMYQSFPNPCRSDTFD